MWRRMPRVRKVLRLALKLAEDFSLSLLELQQLSTFLTLGILLHISRVLVLDNRLSSLLRSLLLGSWGLFLVFVGAPTSWSTISFYMATENRHPDRDVGFSDWSGLKIKLQHPYLGVCFQSPYRRRLSISLLEPVVQNEDPGYVKKDAEGQEGAQTSA
jgi:hypothetical protein